MNDTIKIWRYMDLPRFISLLTKSALYFTSPLKFEDPWEGFVPKALLEKGIAPSLEQMNRMKKHHDEFSGLKSRLNPNHPDFAQANSKFDVGIKTLERGVEALDIGPVKDIEKEKENTGVICWHINEHESDAMWKLYSSKGQGIAIESTVQQLREAITCDRHPKYFDIKYFADDYVVSDEDFKREILSFKRKSFVHEQEYRAFVELKEHEKGQGTYICCDFKKLITRIHVSPISEPYFEEVIKEVCKGKFENIDYLVIRSKLLEKPDYRISTLVK
jgi:hypothetical protein